MRYYLTLAGLSKLRRLAERYMIDWKSYIISAVYAVERRFDRLRLESKLHTGRLKPVEIVPYLRYVTPSTLFLSGRVLEGRGITSPDALDTIWRNLANTAKRFTSVEISGARVRARFGGRDTVATADEKGFFEVRLELAQPLQEKTSWHPIELELLWPRGRGQREVRTTGYVLVSSGTRLGVISDLDDTVVKSSATEPLKRVCRLLVNNARTMPPFEDVADFYKTLQCGMDGREFNPIFYVSSSPWNLYELLVEFLEWNGIPVGPLILKRWDLATIGRRPEHKIESIRRLLSTYPELPFVLLGDSGQSDQDIYHQVAHEHPGRVQAVYIREVKKGESRARASEVHALAGELRDLGVRYGSTSTLTTFGLQSDLDGADNASSPDPPGYRR